MPSWFKNIKTRHILAAILLTAVLMSLFVFHSKDHRIIINASFETKGTSQVFFDIGKGFNQENSVRIDVSGNNHSQRLNFIVPRHIQNSLRIDVSDAPGEILYLQLSHIPAFHIFPQQIKKTTWLNITGIKNIESEENGINLLITETDPHFEIHTKELAPKRLRQISELLLVLILLLFGSLISIYVLKVPLKYSLKIIRVAYIELLEIRTFFPTKINSLSFLALMSIIVVSMLTNTLGITWGLPSFFGWAPDELYPYEIKHALDSHFGNGWHLRYPPFHFYVLGGIYKFIYSTFSISPDALNSVGTVSCLILVGRFVNVLFMTASTIVFFLISSQLFSRRTALIISLQTIWIIPVSYYAKMGNLEAPYIFWFLLSFLFYIRYLAQQKPVQHFFYILFALISVSTKDQAYGLFILPTLYLIYLSIRKNLDKKENLLRSVLSKELIIIYSCFVLFFALFYNLFWNFNGFVSHIKLMVGEGSVAYRLYDQSITGLMKMSLSSLVSVAYGTGLLSLALAGISLASVSQIKTKLAILLPCISYYALFVCVIGYNYLRFFIPVSFACLLISGFVWEQQRYRKVIIPLLIAVSFQGIFITIKTNSLLLNDNRYQAENYLNKNLAFSESVGVFQPRKYTIRRPALIQNSGWEDLQTLIQNQSSHDYLVVLPSVWERAHPELDLLDNFSQRGYQPVLHLESKNTLPLLESKLIHSNLNKIDPEIWIFKKQPTNN